MRARIRASSITPPPLAGRADVLFEAMTLSIGQVRAASCARSPSPRASAGRRCPTPRRRARPRPGFEVISFIGLGVTGGTPVPVVAQLNAAVRKALGNPDTFKRFVELGGEPEASSAEEMQRFVQAEIEKWRKVIALRKLERQ
jgi:tripartite-type tricarboxylate transporter receptor subunit TctC